MRAPCRSTWGLLALLAAFPASLPALGQTPSPTEAGGVIAVGAEARRRLPATVSDAAVTIEVHGRDIRATATALAQRSQTLLTFLRAQGAERLRTEETGFEPELQEVRGQPDRIKGYTGRGTVSFRTLPDRLPILLSGSLENGATGLSQSGSLPREEEVEAARQELAAEATRTALARARAVAAAADARVAGVGRIEVDPSGLPSPFGDPVAMRMERARAPVPAMASAAGEAEVSVRVLVTVRLAPGSGGGGAGN
ncbi:SIMPL domain-containing protein [Roseomonas sp. BN140053]|uniref:SIMPL domain-containing protein n=1 Tax=Roseomonas sp. BN140053 TaxID=3391898 RepID=UPI0039EC0883